MPVARPEPPEIRVIAHLDLDCFYVQVEQRKHPELRGKPTGVVQYNPWKGGALIAVGYEARKFGVKRIMRGDEAREVCPEIQLVQVPVAHGKADLTAYRDAGSEVVAILARKGRCERASIDEVYLDITEASSALLLHKPPSMMEAIPDEALQTHILGLSVKEQKDGEERKTMAKQWICNSDADQRDQMLACGAIIVAELRMAVLAETQFTCSAGIAHNKMLAKLSSGMHKPAQQTLVPSSAVSGLLASLPIKKMKQLGGKLGDSLQSELGVKTVGDLLQFSEGKLQDLYGVNTGSWLWNIARGMCGDEVKGRILPKSHSCGKTFPGPRALRNLASVEHWVGELAAELQERLDVDFKQNHRIAHLLTVHAGTNPGYKEIQERKFPSKSCVLRYGKEKIAKDAIQIFQRGMREYSNSYGLSPGKRESSTNCDWAITSLFLNASNILATPHGVNPITRFFTSPVSPTATSTRMSSCQSSPSSSPPLSPFSDPPFSPNVTHDSGDENIDVSCRRGGLFPLDSRFSNSPSDAIVGDKTYSFMQETVRLSELEETDWHNPSGSHALATSDDVQGLGFPSDRKKVMVGCKEQRGVVGLSGFDHQCISIEQIVAPEKAESCGLLAVGFSFEGRPTSYSAENRSSPLNKANNQCSDSASFVLDEEVMCTPTFGSFYREPKAKNNIQFTDIQSNLKSDSRSGIRTGFIRSENMISGKDLLESGPEPSSSVILCSPVEDTLDLECNLQDLRKIQEESAGINLQLVEEREIARELNDFNNMIGDERASIKARVMQGAPSGSGPGSRHGPYSAKLEHLWQRNQEDLIPSVVTEMTNDTWRYKPGEIDEAVLSELPEEIQEELRNTFGLKRQRSSKRSRIGDFFKSVASHPTSSEVKDRGDS